MLRENQELAQSHPGYKWRSPDSAPFGARAPDHFAVLPHGVDANAG